VTSDLKIDTEGGNVLDCIQVVEDVVMKHGDEIDAVCWQRLKPRLTPDREEMGRAIHDAVNRVDSDPVSIEAALIAADAAIAAMGEP
jgi:hypothetical protein